MTILGNLDELGDDHLVPLERLNHKLAAVNIEKLLSSGRRASEARRFSAAEIILRVT